jgi:hypothetical protein
MTDLDPYENDPLFNSRVEILHLIEKANLARCLQVAAGRLGGCERS